MGILQRELTRQIALLMASAGYNTLIIQDMAERVGFEPTSRFRENTLSKRAPSATRTPLRDLVITNPGGYTGTLYPV